MSESDVGRVREDLAVMRSALGLQRPFEAGHVWANLALALVGAAVMAITALATLSTAPSVRGSAAQWAYVGLIVVPALAALGITALAAHRRRDDAPIVWRESRRAWSVAVLAAPLYLAFAAWTKAHGAAARAVTATTLFLVGLLALVGAATERSRRHTTGWAAASMVAGVVAPLAAYETAGLVAGGWLVAGGLSSAAIMAWELRRRGAS